MKITVTKKTLISSLCILLLGIVIGWCASWFTFQSRLKNVSIVIPDSIIAAENNKIDSLVKAGEDLDSARVRYRDSIIYLIKYKEGEIERVKCLPLDSGIIFFKERIGEYE